MFQRKTPRMFAAILAAVTLLTVFLPINQVFALSAPFIESTYLGGNNEETITDITTDSAGNVIVTGYTNSPNFPNTSGLTTCLDYDYCGSPVGTDAFIAKFSPDLSTLIASTYIGGTDIDMSYAVEVDSQDNIYIAGATSSPGFLPNLVSGSTVGYGSNNGYVDAFILKVNNDLDTFLGYAMAGGSGFDIFHDIDISGSNIHAVGSTNGSAVQAIYDKDMNTSTKELEESMFETFNSGTFYGVDNGYVVGQVSNQAAVVKFTNPFEIFLGQKPSITLKGSGIFRSVVYNTVTSSYWAVGNGDTADTSLRLFEFTSPSSTKNKTLSVGATTPFNEVTFDPTTGDVSVIATSDSTTAPTQADPGFSTNSNAGGDDAYVVQLSEGAFDDSNLTTGDILYASYHGSTGDETGASITYNSYNSKYVIGGITDVATWAGSTGAADTTYNGGSHDSYVSTIDVDTPPVVVEAPLVYNDNLFPGFESTDPDVDFTSSGDYQGLISTHFIPIDPAKSYKIKGEFKSSGSVQSRINFGFSETDLFMNQILPVRVARISPVSDKVTFSSISTDRKTINLTGSVPASWCADDSDTFGSGTSCSTQRFYRNVAIYFDGDTTKLPDYVFEYDTATGTSIVLKDALHEAVAGSLTSSTVFLNHMAGDTFNYSAARNEMVPFTWTNYESGIITGENFGIDDMNKFRTGTAEIRLTVLANLWQYGLDTQLDVRNVGLYEVTGTGEEIPVSISAVTNQDVKPRFECQTGETVVMQTGSNNTLLSTEGSHTVSAKCEDDATGVLSDEFSITVEIDKTAPVPPTWDQIESGTYSGPQTISVTPDSGNVIVAYSGAGSDPLKYMPSIAEIYMQSDGSSDRDYSAAFRQRDEAGNLSGYTSIRYYTITP